MRTENFTQSPRENEAAFSGLFRSLLSSWRMVGNEQFQVDVVIGDAAKAIKKASTNLLLMQRICIPMQKFPIPSTLKLFLAIHSIKFK